jgi:hypothetical protein
MKRCLEREDEPTFWRYEPADAAARVSQRRTRSPQRLPATNAPLGAQDTPRA